MNFYRSLHDDIKIVIWRLSADGDLPSGLDLSRISVEPARDPSHGDAAANAAMVLAKAISMNPRDVAQMIADKLADNPKVKSVEVAGPGFINLRLTTDFWHARLSEILTQGVAYGDCTLGMAEKVNVEFVSANPTGPMHVGHCRGAVFGDALAELLKKAGYDVTREYYINDAGTQVDVLARSAYLRYLEALGEAIGEIPEGLYPGDYLVPVGKQLAEKYADRFKGKEEPEWLQEIREFTVAAMMELIREDLAALGVEMDEFFSERKMVEAGKVGEGIALLSDKGLIYEGVLEPPKGKKPENWEEREQTLFKATDFGDDVDRPLRKSDGSHTYFAADIAYHLDKFNRGFSHMIDVWGADHGGYVKRMKAAVSAISAGEADLDVKICQLVHLTDKGEPVKMSKRSGTFITLREVVEEVGKDVVRFIMLTRKNDDALNFDFAKVQEHSKDNPVFYVQYAHARCHSVMRMAKEAFAEIDCSLETLAELSYTRLTSQSEIALIALLATWPRVVEGAAEAHEPHRCAFFLNDVAAGFHALWNKGNEDAMMRFLVPEDQELTQQRLALVKAVATVIASGLKIFGVVPVKEMR